MLSPTEDASPRLRRRVAAAAAAAAPKESNLWKNVLERRDEAMKRLLKRDERALQLQLKQLDKDMRVAMRMCDRQTQFFKQELKKRQRRRVSLQAPPPRSSSASAPPPRIVMRWKSTSDLQGDNYEEEKERLRRGRKISMGLSPVTCMRREMTSEIRGAVSLPCVIEESVWEDDDDDDDSPHDTMKPFFKVATPVANRRRGTKERMVLPPITTSH